MLTRRYVKHTISGGTRYDILWTDRKTGEVIIKYDGADPANRVDPDWYIFSKRGRDIDEKIEESECVCPIPLNEIDREAEREWEDFCDDYPE
jgi:hypothetical protein